MSAAQKLESSLRRIRQMRELSSPAELVETEIELARSIWRDVPIGTMHWDDDLQPLAAELGFDPDARERGPNESFFGRLDAQLDEHIGDEIAAERTLYQLAAQIEREILAGVSGLQELHVVASGTTVVLTGGAVDATAKTRAGAIATNLVPPGTTVDNQLVVEW